MDYTTVIREQIIRDVKRLHRQESWRSPRYAHIGYLINSHKGMPVFKDGDVIDGLEVHIDAAPLGRPMSIKVGDVSSVW